MQQTSIRSFSYLRVISCFSILILHCLFCSKVVFEKSLSEGNVLFEKVAESMLMWGVPCFLMITGALLLNSEKTVSAKKLFGKYLRRILLALICFTLLFSILDYFKGGKDLFIKDFFHDLIFAESWPHMWYLYLMISIYLMIPLYKAITAKLSDKWIIYTITILLIFNSLGPVFDAAGISISAFSIPVITIYPAYLFMGYYLYNHKPKMIHAVIVVIICAAAIIAGTIVYIKGLSDNTILNKILAGISEYSSIFVVLGSGGLFSIAISINWKESRVINSIDRCTFGIYLIHMIGIKAVTRWMNINLFDYSYMFIILPICLFILSYLVTYTIRSIPKLKLL